MYIKKHHWMQIGQFFTAGTNYDGVVLNVNVHRNWHKNVSLMNAILFYEREYSFSINIDNRLLIQ